VRGESASSPPPVAPRVVAGAACLLLAVALAAAGAAPWLDEWGARRARSGESTWVETLPWAPRTQRAAAVRLLRTGALGPAADAERLLLRSADARPLYAPTWLESAAVARHRGASARARRRLDLAATLWPERALHQRRVAVERVESGDRVGGFRALRAVLRAEPDRSAEVLRFARHLEGDAARMLSELLPSGALPRPERDALLLRVLRWDCGPGDGPLGDAAWGALSSQARGEREPASRYVGCLLEQGDADRARAVWDAHVPGGHSLERVSNAGFEWEPLQSGLGWRIAAPEGASWTRDASVRSEGRYSLRVDFERAFGGDYHHLSQIVLVEPAHRYRLHGRWRREGFRAGGTPYLEVSGWGAGEPFRRVRPLDAAPAGAGAWSSLVLDFATGAGTRFALIRLRRDPPPGDGDVAGSLWLDDIRLEPLPEARSRG
jgi:hypothetical protein